MGFSRQEYWSRLPFSTPENLPDPGVEPESLMFPALAVGSLPLVPPGKPQRVLRTMCCCSAVESYPTPCDPLARSMPGSSILHCLPEFAQVHVHWVRWCCLTSSPSDARFFCLQSFPASVLWVRWPKYWSFSFSISPSNEYSGLSSFRINWLDLLAVNRTLKSLLQDHNLKASVIWCSAFFMI